MHIVFKLLRFLTLLSNTLFFPLIFYIIVQSVDEFKADVQAAKAQGRRVGLSVGGADAHVEVTAVNNATFASSLLNILNTYDFDGIDIDLEQGAVASTDAEALGWAMRTVRNARLSQGKNCFFSMSPGMCINIISVNVSNCVCVCILITNINIHLFIYRIPILANWHVCQLG